MSSPALTLYTFPLSGHGHRVELFLHLLGLPYEKRLVDLRSGAHKQPEFLSINPFGQVPALVDGDLVLPDSNAILVYLAKRYGSEQWLPQDPVGAARVQRWLSVAAGELMQGPALARAMTIFRRGDPAPHQARATALFSLLEAHLSANSYLVGDHATIADIALYTYTSVSHEGGVSLEAYPAIRTWLQRVEALPNFLPMPAVPAAS